MPGVRPFSLLLALGLAAPGPLGKLKKDDRPVHMRAKGGIQVDLKRRVGVATNDVVISRDDVTVCCDRAEAVYDEQRIRKVTCTGRVVIVRPDGTKAAADAAIFEADANAVTLKGRARVWTTDARLTGKRIVYDIGADTISVVGGESRFAFDPKGKTPPSNLRACPVPEAEAP